VGVYFFAALIRNSFQGDFLQNQHNIDFGTRHCGSKVSDVSLPPWAKTPADFVNQLREALESDYVSRNLHLWIDLIFGYKQRGKEADRANNLFYHLCYEGSVDLDTIVNLEERYALEVQIGEFGQVPKQIFTSPHPQKIMQAQQIYRNLSNHGGGGGGDTFDAASGSSGENSSDCASSPGKRVKPSMSVVETEVTDIKYWKDMSLMKRVCDYKVHREALSAVAMSVDNLWIFSASHDSILKMYSLEEMQVMRSISVANMTLSACVPLPNNKTVLLGSKDNNLCAYSIEYGRTSDYLEVHR
jgi:factor associated with neutral sphingomyelinase activation